MAKSCFWGPAKMEEESLRIKKNLVTKKKHVKPMSMKLPILGGLLGSPCQARPQELGAASDARGCGGGTKGGEIQFGSHQSPGIEEGGKNAAGYILYPISLYSTFHIYIRFLTHSHVQFDTFLLFSKWVNGFSWLRHCLGSIFVAFLLAPATTPLQVGWKDGSLPGRRGHFCKGSSRF